MNEVRATTETLLDEKPGIEDGLRSVLAVDAEQDCWAFEDVPLDSGEFGEVVSRGIVEQHGDGYRVADSEATAAALGVEPPGGAERVVPFDGSYEPRDLLRGLVPTVERTTAAYLGFALALVVLFRIVPYPAVFRGGDVLLSSNDPYAYRFVVEQMVAEARGPLDVAVLFELPGDMSNGEPLLVSVLWWIAELLGGGRRTTGLVLAWYPVVSAAVTGVLVYLLAARATNDRRVGVAAVSMLAVMPLHAFRTGLGFADHHAFDYPWLVLTALALVLLVDREVRSVRTWGVAGVLGFAVAGQLLAWDSGGLLLVPLALFVVLRVLSDLRAGQSPLGAGAPVAGGVAFGAVLVQLAHAGLGWHTGAVASVPVVSFAGIAVILLVAAGHARLGGTPSQFIALLGVVGAGVAVTAAAAFPLLVSELHDGVGRLLQSPTAVEAAPLLGDHFNWLLGPLVFFGFALLLVIPYIAWAGWRTYRTHDPALLVVTAYGWFFLALTAIQIRFGGEFSPFAAVFAGLGFVHLASWVDLARTPRVFSDGAADPRSADGRADLEWPERRTAMYTAGLWLAVGGLGALMSAVKHDQVQIDDGDYETATWIASDSESRGLEYPDNYVLAPWGRVRMYNYFVNGRSRDFLYARNNYDDFLNASRPDSWYRRFEDRVGYVVLTPDSGGDLAIQGSTYTRLNARFGTGSEGVDGLGHYRARYVSEDGNYKVFEVAAGAALAGFTDENSDVSASAEVEIDGETFTYERRATSDETGWFEITVAYPGTYAVGDRTVRVTEAAVRSGERVRVDE